MNSPTSLFHLSRFPSLVCLSPFWPHLYFVSLFLSFIIITKNEMYASTIGGCQITPPYELWIWSVNALSTPVLGSSH
jgi:hypothetical protein